MTGDHVSPATVQKMLAWLSPAFPVGSYAYSHGLEWAIADGSVCDAASLQAWIGDVLRYGAGRNDAVVFAHAWRAVAEGDAATLTVIADLAAAFQPSRERHLEATAQGRAFLKAVCAAWPTSSLLAVAGALDDRAVTYPVALGVAAAAHDIPAKTILPAMLAAFVANLTSVGVRAIPIGQTDGQRIAARLAGVDREVAEDAIQLPLDDLGGAALRADLA